MSSDKLIRVGGRLKHSSDTVRSKGDMIIRSYFIARCVLYNIPNSIARCKLYIKVTIKR